MVETGKRGVSRSIDIAHLISFLVSPIAGAIAGESIAVRQRVHGLTHL